MKVNRDDDRRRFFRITDAIGVAYELASDVNENTEGDTENQEKIDVKGLLNQHNETINSLVSELKAEQPKAADAIDAINKKLDTLIHFFELDSLSSHQHFQKIEEASISACGIAFPINESLSVGENLKLTLYLQPSDEEVFALGKVVGCSNLGDDSYYLRVEFVEMDDRDREGLIQHIVQRQGALLKSLREQLGD